MDDCTIKERGEDRHDSVFGIGDSDDVHGDAAFIRL